MTPSTPDEPASQPRSEPPPAGPGAAGPERTHDQVLADAVRVLTEAARLTRPVLVRDESASEGAAYPVWVPGPDREPADWAEFVTQALVGAAANVGSIGAALDGRPGSWEAEGVRNLLTSTVGEDDQELLRHRTEPVVVTLYVEVLMADLDAYGGYDQAQKELSRRAEAVAPSATSPEGAAALPPLTEEQERQLDAVADLEERLEQMRAQDYANYGQALKANVEAAAARRGLPVPVKVVVDLESFGPPSSTGGRRYVSIADDLHEEAIDATPLPGGGRTPLDRLENP